MHMQNKNKASFWTAWHSGVLSMQDVRGCSGLYAAVPGSASPPSTGQEDRSDALLTPSVPGRYRNRHAPRTCRRTKLPGFWVKQSKNLQYQKRLHPVRRHAHRHARLNVRTDTCHACTCERSERKCVWQECKIQYDHAAPWHACAACEPGCRKKADSIFWQLGPQGCRY